MAVVSSRELNDNSLSWRKLSVTGIGNDDAGHRTQVKRKEGAVSEGEAVEGLVDKGTKEVQVANDRQPRPRTRREEATRTGASPGEKVEDDKG